MSAKNAPNGMIDLSALGPRIAIIGPSNSGKSTLANVLSAKLGLPVYHLDQYAHIAGTNWVRRPVDDFVADHTRLISQDTWVMDGNYSVCMEDRLKRATAIIWVEPPRIGFLWRYIYRLFIQRHYPGKLNGAHEKFGWGLVRHTFFGYPKFRKKYKLYVADADHAARIHMHSMRELNAYYQHWNLALPT